MRVSKEQDHFLISPKGVSCSEVTASSLVSIDSISVLTLTKMTGPMCPWRDKFISESEPTVLFLVELTLSLGKEDMETQWVPQA